MRSGPSTRKLLLVGGSGGLLGRHLLPHLASQFSVSSVHREPVPSEASFGVNWVGHDIGSIADWSGLTSGVEVVVNVAWLRQGRERPFRILCEGLVRLVEAARAQGVRRFLQVSVPPAPESLETTLPYLVYKRRFDATLAQSGLSYAIVRPSMLFGPRDRLLTVMLRLMHRYRIFPMFGDGEYHLSPIAADDVARHLAHLATDERVGTWDLAGPVRYRYRDLTDLMFAMLGRRPRYFRIGPRGSVRLASFMEALRLSMIYAYEVEWLLSDTLGLPPGAASDGPLQRVEPFLESEAAKLRSGRWPRTATGPK